MERTQKTVPLHSDQSPGHFPTCLVSRPCLPWESERKACCRNQSFRNRNGVGVAWELNSLIEADDTYRVALIPAGAEQIDPLFSLAGVVEAADRRVFRGQSAGCERKGVPSECAVFFVDLTVVVGIVAELPDVFPGGMYHVMDAWAKPVLPFAPHISHKAVTVAVEALRVGNLGVVDV